MTHASVELVRAPQLTDQVPYAYAAVATGSRTVFTAGACPVDENDDVVCPDDLTGQARQVMANLEAALHASGATLHSVLKTTVYVATDRREDLLAAWEVVRAAFGDHDAPSTLLGVTLLGYTGQLVEVEAIAVRDA